MFLYLIFIIICLLIFVALSDWFSREARLIRKIPGLKAWPIVGNSLSCMLPPEKLGYFIWDLQKDYGHLSQIHAMKFRMVIITNPDDMETILTATKNVSKADFYKFATPWLGDGLLLSMGTKWQQRKKLLTQAFHYNILKKFMVTFKEETEELLKDIEEETAANGKANLLRLMRPISLRIICETAMGVSLREDKVAYTKYFNSIKRIIVCMISRFTKIWLHNDFLFNLTEIARIQKNELRHIHDFINKVIKDRRDLLNKTNVNVIDDPVQNDKNEKIAMLDLLLQNEKSGIINNEGIREEVNTVMFAGHDTTTVALSFFTMSIANESAIQDKIYVEQKRILGDSQRSPTFEELSEMKYLECCIKETLRMYPSAPFFSRKLLEDTVLSGYTVPAGTTCLLFIFALQRSPDLFPDPERFDPDRFLPENCQNRHQYSYLPFSAGLRSCLGQKFAMLEMKMILSGMIRRFRVEPVTKPSDLIFRADMILRTKDPIYVRFRSRKFRK